MIHSLISNTAIFSCDNYSIETTLVNDLNFEYLFHNKRLAFDKQAKHTTADPFLYATDKELYLFVEEVCYNGKGEIMAYKSENLSEWKALGNCLPKDFHLSYPFVFKKGEYYFLLPESEGQNELNLYTSKDLEKNWQYHKTLLNGPYNDSNILYHNNLYWLFTSIGYSELYIYFSNDLQNWKPISEKPVVSSLKYGRNGGGAFIYDNQLYRIAQNCEQRYGNNLVLLKIHELSTNNYHEEVINDDFFPAQFWWNKFGSHHFNMTTFKGKTIIAVDGFCNNFIANKAITAIKKILPA